jgi:hypothetical protein
MFKNEIIWGFLLPVIKQFWYAGGIGWGRGHSLPENLIIILMKKPEKSFLLDR